MLLYGDLPKWTSCLATTLIPCDFLASEKYDFYKASSSNKKERTVYVYSKTLAKKQNAKVIAKSVWKMLVFSDKETDPSLYTAH